MRSITRSLHGLADYIIGIILLAAPWLFVFHDPYAKGISLTFGAILILYSLLTDEGPALLRVIPFPIHRTLDFLLGVGLLFSFVQFDLRGRAAVVFAALGLFQIWSALAVHGRFIKSGRDKPLAPGMK